MFTRQKILLTMLQVADRPVSRMELTKWSFVLKHQSQSKGGDSFYDFLPYHYGPFSFALYQEMDKLVAQGYAAQGDSSHWVLGKTALPTLDRTLGHEVRGVAQRLKNRHIDNLLDEIYTKFPEYTVNSKRLQLASRKIAAPAVYTSGYEGVSIDGFLNRLITTGIKHLIDVRRNPIARRYGFHRSTLKRLCESLDIAYTHLPELGIESEMRQSLETQEDYEALFERYRKSTLVDEKLAVERVAKLVRESPSVLVCMEAQPKCCHRSHLAADVSKRSHLKVDHLI